MPVLPSWLVGPFWERFCVLLAQRHDRYPPGCQRSRIGDRMVFELLVDVLIIMAPGTGAIVTAAARRPCCDDAAMSGSAPGLWAGWKPHVRAATLSSDWKHPMLPSTGA